jgi:hypothetical protein
MSDLEARISAIELRNARVSFDKAWETSWIRRGMIAGITYVCGIILLNILGHEGAWKHASVPVMGYLLSTLSLPAVKKLWVERKEKEREIRNVTIH